MRTSHTSATLSPPIPRASDSIAQGDNHIRNTKLDSRNTFPNIDGEVKASDEELNNLQGVIRPISDIIQMVRTRDSALRQRSPRTSKTLRERTDIARTLTLPQASSPT